MRVIVLNDYGYVSGGAAQVAISSLNHLADAGLDVIFVSAVGPVDSGIKRGVKVVNFGLHDLLDNPSRIRASIRGIWDTECADRFLDVLGKCDPADTLVHLHSWVKSLSSSVAQVAISRRFRTVCTLHDYFSVCPNGGLYNFPQQKPCLLRPMSLSCVASNCDSRSYAQKLWRVGREFVQDRFGGIPSRLKYFITVSEYSESLLRPWLPTNAEFFRIRNPIAIKKVPLSTVEGNSAFTFVGRLSAEKGPDVFAQAARLAQVRAVFVGSGPKENTIASINPSVELLGWQDRADVVRAIQSSRALVFSSLLHETQGMAVLEAAALGVPAIVADSCAAKCDIVDGETGLLFRANDASDLAAKLSLLNRDSEMAARLGRKAYDRYWANPSTIEIHTQQLIACYEDVMGRRSSDGALTGRK
jgi:glycosyltransferase involved in cell wall biosynthesis